MTDPRPHAIAPLAPVGRSHEIWLMHLEDAQDREYTQSVLQGIGTEEER